MNLDVLDGGAVTHALHGQAIDLVVGTSHQPALGDAHIANHAAVVAGHVAAVTTDNRAALAFNVAPDFAGTEALAGTTGTVLRCKALDDHATPLAEAVKVIVSQAGEGDRAGFGTDSHQPGTAGDQQGTVVEGANVYARLDGQGDTAGVDAVEVRLAADELVAVADNDFTVEAVLHAAHEGVVFVDGAGDGAVRRSSVEVAADEGG